MSQNHLNRQQQLSKFSDKIKTLQLKEKQHDAKEAKRIKDLNAIRDYKIEKKNEKYSLAHRRKDNKDKDFKDKMRKLNIKLQSKFQKGSDSDLKYQTTQHVENNVADHLNVEVREEKSFEDTMELNRSMSRPRQNSTYGATGNTQRTISKTTLRQNIFGQIKPN